MRRAGWPAWWTCAAPLLTYLLGATPAGAACDCGAASCTGQSIAVTLPDRDGDVGVGLDASSCSGCNGSGVATWTLSFTCGGGDCTCGRYVNGDYWVRDPDCGSTTTTGSVRLSAETPSSRNCGGNACNGLVKNPTLDDNGWDGRISWGPTYTPSLDITLPYDANSEAADGAAVFLKALSYNPSSLSCGGGGCTGSNEFCIHAYAPVTVVCEIPPNDAWRPPYYGKTKPAASHGTDPAWREVNVDYGFVPSFDVESLPGAISLEQAYARIRLPQVDSFRSPGGGNQGLVALLNSGGPGSCMTYGANVAISRSESLMLAVGASPFASGSPSRLDLLRAWIQAGVDYYGIVEAIGTSDDGVWMPAGGHGAGRKAPLVVAALLLDDPSMRQAIRDLVAAATASPYRKMFNEDALAYWSTTAIGGARALYGEVCPQHGIGTESDNCSEWWDYDPWEEHCRDPVGYIDGGSSSVGLPSGYMYNVTSANGYALVQTFWPQLREIWGHDAFWQLLDRLEGWEALSGDVGPPGGVWAMDNCTNAAPSCSIAPASCVAGSGRMCGSATCASQHGNAGRGAWGYASSFVEEGYVAHGSYVAMRACDLDPTLWKCVGYVGLQCGDSVSGTAWCSGPECPACDGAAGAGGQSASTGAGGAAGSGASSTSPDGADEVPGDSGCGCRVQRGSSGGGSGVVLAAAFLCCARRRRISAARRHVPLGARARSLGPPPTRPARVPRARA